MSHSLRQMDLDSLGYAPDDVATLEDVDCALKALGYDEFFIITGRCLQEKPPSTVDRLEYSKMFMEFEAEGKELVKRREQAEVLLKVKLQEEATVCGVSCDGQIYNLKQQLQHFIPNQEVLLHQRANYLRSLKIVESMDELLACRSALMSKRLQLLTKELGGRLETSGE